MQRRDNAHSQFAQEGQDVSAGGSTENAELVLQADDVDVADVEKVRGAQIGGEVLFLNLETNHLRVFVATRNVVDRDGQALALGMGGCDGRQQVRRECGDAAFARQEVANKSNLVDVGSFLDEAVSIVAISVGPVSIATRRAHVILSARKINGQAAAAGLRAGCEDRAPSGQSEPLEFGQERCKVNPKAFWGP